MLRADLHVHTAYSPDSTNTPERIIARCRERGINCVAIADHNTMEGALRLREVAPFKVIVAEEVRTSEGEIMGLFLTEPIPRGLSPEETVARIKAQGGLVSVPHPWDHLRRSTLTAAAFARIADQLDLIEVFNCRSLFRRQNDAALAYALANGLPQAAGSDAHIPYEIGGAFVEVADFEDKDEFLAALRGGRVVGRRATPLVHVASSVTKWRRRLRSQP